jgi:hypothetical protein
LPEPEFEFVVGRSELQYIDGYAFLCLAEGVENWDVLFTKKGETPGTTIYDRAGEGATCW